VEKLRSAEAVLIGKQASIESKDLIVGKIIPQHASKVSKTFFGNISPKMYEKKKKLKS